MKRIISAAASLIIMLVPATALAAAPAPANTVTPGLTISPAIKQLNLASDQKSTSFTAQITNNTKSQLVVNVSTTDFTALNETGGIVFLPNLTNRPHGLAQWLKPAKTQVVLPPDGSQAVPIIVTPTAGLAPGGHYGALVYRVVAAGSGAKGNQVGSNQELTSLVFLTTANGGTQSVKLGKLSVGHVMLKIPSTINLVLTNTGNTQVAPSGLVTVADSSNKEVARGIINPDSGLVLPGTSRLYTVALRSETKVVAYPGTYHLAVAYQANGMIKASVYSTNFLLVNKAILIVSGLFILLVAAGLIRRFSSGIVYRRRKL
jgi:hypothetical protein